MDTRTTPLIATRADCPEHTPEAEPVVVEAVGDVVRFVLDDNIIIDFDRAELSAAIAA